MLNGSLPSDVFGRVDHAAGDACIQPETVCNTAGTVTLTCGADNKLAEQVCSAGTRCSALPKLDAAGVTIQCNTDADAQKILAVSVLVHLLPHLRLPTRYFAAMGRVLRLLRPQYVPPSLDRERYFVFLTKSQGANANSAAGSRGVYGSLSASSGLFLILCVLTTYDLL